MGRETVGGAGLQSFAYDGGALVATYIGNSPTFYVWGPTGPIQEFGNVSPNQSPGPITFTYDPNGSLVALALTGETTVMTLGPNHLYDAYGQPVWPYAEEPGVNAPENYQGVIFRYKGQAGYVTDTDVDLIYCWYRYYDPIAARWISRDPTGLDGGVNTYTYCDGNPLVLVDPEGTQVTDMFRAAFNYFCGIRQPQDVGGFYEITGHIAADTLPGPWGFWAAQSYYGGHEGDWPRALLVGGVHLAEMAAFSFDAEEVDLLEIPEFTTATAKIEYASEFGIQPFNTMRARILGSELQAHHLIEKRFADLLGERPGRMLSIAMKKGPHQGVTNAWRTLIGYGDGTRKATKAQVINAAKDVYRNNPELLKALGIK